VRTFVRHFFDGNANMFGETLSQELRMTEPMACVFFFFPSFPVASKANVVFYVVFFSFC